MADPERPHSHGIIDRTRTPEQQAAYERTVGAGICPFCGETHEMPKEIQEAMIYEGNHWRVWFNPFPYPGHKNHLILAPIEHLTQPNELSDEAKAEWFDLNNKAIEELGIQGGGLVMRFGNPEFKGNSITHLHSHIQEPDGSTFSIATFFASPALIRFFKQQSESGKRNSVQEGAVTIDQRKISLGEWLEKIRMRTNPKEGGEIEAAFANLKERLENASTWHEITGIEVEAAIRFEPKYWEGEGGIIYVNNHF